MSFCVLTIRDGRGEIEERSLVSLKEYLPEPEYHIVIDDAAHELGFAGAVAAGWERVRATGAEWVFHHEADFLYLAPVPLDRFIAVLRRHPNITQMALKRQAVNVEERAAGGIVELHPDDFQQRHDAGDVYTLHRRFFTTNPSLYPASLCAQGWPRVPESEGIFSRRLFDHDPDACSAIWGAKFDPPLVEHIGVERTGSGY